LLFRLATLFLVPQTSLGFITESHLRFQSPALFFFGSLELFDLRANSSFLFGSGARLFFDLAAHDLELGQAVLFILRAPMRFLFDPSGFLFSTASRFLQASVLFFFRVTASLSFKAAAFFFSCQPGFLLGTQVVLLLYQ
jgi:hypothetical protein